MSEFYRFTILGEPMGQERARAFPYVIWVFDPKKNKQVPKARVRFHDAEKSRSWKETAALLMRETGLPYIDTDIPVQLFVRAVFACPKSDFRKRVPRPRRRHTKTPDGDNVLKIIKDAAKGVLWNDDRQVSDGRCVKWIGAQGERPRLEVFYKTLPVEDESATPARTQQSIDGVLFSEVGVR